MKPRERVLKAINREEPDRVPVYANFTPEVLTKLKKALECDNDVDLSLKMGNDMIVATHGIENSFYASEESEFTDEWGVRWVRVDHAYGHYTEIAENPLSDKKKLESYQIPDPNENKRYEKVEQLIQKYGNEYWIVGSVACTIFETSWYLRGQERLLRDMIRDKEFVHDLMDKVMKFSKTVAERLVKIGVDMIWLGDDVGGQNSMLISPKLWREFLKPRMARIISSLKDLNPDVKIAYHSDGYFIPIIDELIDIGVDVLNPVQPKAMDPSRLKEEFGDRLSFWGTMDIQETFPHGTPEDVEAEVKERVRTVGKGGGLILGPSHNIQSDTPLENIFAFYNAARKFGVYE